MDYLVEKMIFFGVTAIWLAWALCTVFAESWSNRSRLFVNKIHPLSATQRANVRTPAFTFWEIVLVFVGGLYVALFTAVLTIVLTLPRPDEVTALSMEAARLGSEQTQVLLRFLPLLFFVGIPAAIAAGVLLGMTRPSKIDTTARILGRSALGALPVMAIFIVLYWELEKVSTALSEASKAHEAARMTAGAVVQLRLAM